MSGVSRTGARGRVIALVSALVVAMPVTGLAPAHATGRDLPQTAALAQRAIESSLAATGATSITAGLTDLDGLLWQGTAGVLDSSGASPSPTTRYGIGSTTKTLTAAAVMQLVDAGRIGLDQPVVRYLPEFTMLSPQYRQITVRMLLDHSAGLPGTGYADIFTTRAYPEYVEQVFANLARSRLKTTPGAMSVYCNDCITLAGEVVAAVSGMPYATYVARNLLAPLGMDDSLFITGRKPAAGTVARLVSQGTTWPLEVTNALASGGMLSTPQDMLAFARMLMADGRYAGQQVLSASSVRQMGTSQLATTLDPITRNVWNYGLGWDTVDDLVLEGVGVRAWVKGGDTGHYHSSLVVAPDADLAVFVAGAGTYGSGAAQAVAEEILLNALAERGDIPAVPARLGTDQPPAVVPTEDDVNAIVGHYLGTGRIAYRISRGPGTSLVVDTLIDGTWTPGSTTISLRSDGAWWADAPRALSMRAVTGWGRTYLVVSMPTGYGSAYGEQAYAQRVAPAGPIADAWRERLGDWLNVDEDPTSTAWLGQPVTTIARIPGLPGYLEVRGMAPVDARDPDIGSMFLQVPLMWGRDHDDLVPVGRGMLRMGTSVMVDRDRVAALPSGRSVVRIAADGYAQWRAVPEASRLAIDGAEAWYLYDAGVMLAGMGRGDPATLRAPAGSLLVVFDDAGGTVDVRVTPRG